MFVFSWTSGGQVVISGVMIGLLVAASSHSFGISVMVLITMGVLKCLLGSPRSTRKNLSWDWCDLLGSAEFLVTC